MAPASPRGASGRRHATRWLTIALLVCGLAIVASVTIRHHTVMVLSPATLQTTLSSDPRSLMHRSIVVGGVVEQVWRAGRQEPGAHVGNRAAGRLLVLVGAVHVSCYQPSRTDFRRGSTVQVIGEVCAVGRAGGRTAISLADTAILPKAAADQPVQVADDGYCDPRYGFQLTYRDPTLVLVPGTTSDGTYAVRVVPNQGGSGGTPRSLCLVTVTKLPPALRTLLRSESPAERGELAPRLRSALRGSLLDLAVRSGAALGDLCLSTTRLSGLPALRCRWTTGPAGRETMHSAACAATLQAIYCQELAIGPGTDATVGSAIRAVSLILPVR